jgi:multisubunit Na+/H+ antiporter MnhE subunit
MDKAMFFTGFLIGFVIGSILPYSLKRLLCKTPLPTHLMLGVSPLILYAYIYFVWYDYMISVFQVINTFLTIILPMLMGFLIGFSAQTTALFIRRVKRIASSLQRAKTL